MDGRLEAGGKTASDMLIVGGEDHKTGQAHDADERYARLEAWARERFPMMQEIKFRCVRRSLGKGEG
jgi:hypothetical protein